MRFLETLRNAFVPQVKTLDLSELSARAVLDFAASRSLPGRMGDAALLAAFHRVPALHGPVDLVAQRVASVPIFATLRGKRLNPQDRHPAALLIASPNAEMTWGTFLSVSMIHHEIVGEWIWVWFAGDSGRAELFPIPPYRAKLTESGDWEITLSSKWIVPFEQVVWVKTPDVTDPMGRGKGKGHVVLDEIEIDEYAAQLEKAEFYNHAQPALVIRMRGAGDEARRKFKEDFYQNFRGVEGRGRPLVVGGTDEIEFEQISRPLADALVESMRRLSTEIIDSVWNIPPEWRGRLSDSNRATITMSEIVGTRNIVVPRVTKVIETLNAYVAPAFGPDVWFDYEDPTPANLDLILEYSAKHPGDLLINERRALFAELPPLAGGDVREVGPEHVPDKVVERGAAPDPLDDPALAGIVVRFADYQTKGPEEDAERILRALQPDILAEAVGAAMSAEYTAAGMQALAAVDVAATAEVLNPFLMDYAREFAAVKIVRINETTREAVREVIVRGLELGKNPHAIKGDVEAVFQGIPKWRAETIARTEMVGAANNATFSAYSVAGVPKLEWIATWDDRTRESHAAMDGQIVERGALFLSGNNNPTKFPGAFGIAEEDCNCRCTIGAVFDFGSNPKRDVDQRRALWKSFDTDTEDRVRRFLPHLLRGFDAQRVAVLESIDRVLGTRAA